MTNIIGIFILIWASVFGFGLAVFKVAIVFGWLPGMSFARPKVNFDYSQPRLVIVRPDLSFGNTAITFAFTSVNLIDRSYPPSALASQYGNRMGVLTFPSSTALVVAGN
jgi:hypothetical protein